DAVEDADEVLDAVDRAVLPHGGEQADRLALVRLGRAAARSAAGADLEVRLAVARLGQVDAEHRLDVQQLPAREVEHVRQGRTGKQRLVDHLVVVVAALEVESEGQFEIVDVEGADGQVVWADLEQVAV